MGVSKSVALRRAKGWWAGCSILIALAVFVLWPQMLRAQEDGAELATRAEPLGWSEGVSDAVVTVVEFTDVSCPYCASFNHGTREALSQEFVASGQVRWITLTYISGLYPNSRAVSVAAECAGRQGEYHRFLAAAYEARASWVDEGTREVEASIDSLAGDLELDPSDFEACRTDPAVVGRLEAIEGLAEDVGVRGTPTWFVDGFLVMGDLPLGYARQFIERQLAGN